MPFYFRRLSPLLPVQYQLKLAAALGGRVNLLVCITPIPSVRYPPQVAASPEFTCKLM